MNDFTEGRAPAAPPHARHAVRRRRRGAAVPACRGPRRRRAAELRIGFQKYGTLTLLKERGTLEQRLARAGHRGQLDRVPGRSAAARRPERGRHRFRHRRRGAADLRPGRGRRLGLCRQRAAGAAGARRSSCRRTRRPHASAELQGQEGRAEQGLERALPAGQGAGEGRTSTTATIQPVYLPPADARAAFERGAVDAWVIWDPFLAAAEKQLGARVLADGNGLVAQPPVLPGLARLRRRATRSSCAALHRGAGHGRRVGPRPTPQDVAAILSAADRPAAPAIGGAGAQRYRVRREAADAPRCCAEQQKIADTFHAPEADPEADRGRDAQPSGKRSPT